MTHELTGIVIAKNEQKDLPGCLESMEAFCDTTVVIDNESTDHTAEIAAKYGAKVINAVMYHDDGFAGLRNVGLRAVETSHAVFLDADERPDVTLVDAILAAKHRGAQDTAYKMMRRNNAFGGWLDHGRFGGDGQVRLFPSDTQYSGVVHEVPDLPESTEIITLDGTLEHFTYASLGEYIKKMRDYSIKSVQKGDPVPSISDSAAKFRQNLIDKQAYKDGWRGIAMIGGDAWADHLMRQANRIHS